MRERERERERGERREEGGEGRESERHFSDMDVAYIPVTQAVEEPP